MRRHALRQPIQVDPFRPKPVLSLLALVAQRQHLLNESAVAQYPFVTLYSHLPLEQRPCLFPAADTAHQSAADHFRTPPGADTLIDKRTILTSGCLLGLGEHGQNRPVILPLPFLMPHDHAVVQIPVSVQPIEIVDHAGAKRIQMNVTGQFEQVGILRTKYRFVAILK